MRDFSRDTSALALNTATLGHNLDGHGAGWSPEQVIDACAARGYGGIVFWRREIGDRAVETIARIPINEVHGPLVEAFQIIGNHG